MECTKCNTRMMKAKFCADTAQVGAYLTNKKKGLLESEKISKVSCYVCPDCGYIELYADDPRNLTAD